MNAFCRKPSRFRKPLLVAAYFLLEVVVGITSQAQGGPCATGQVANEIAAANMRLGNAVAAGDAVAISNMYTTSAELLPPGHSLVSGRAAIKSFWSAAVKSMSALSLTAEEVECTDDIAIERGTFVTTTAQGKARGKYLVVWKHVNGQWMLHRDCWNSDAP
jgi:ketosteroid isomerase-like protein